MTRPAFETLTTALLAALVCVAPLACDSGSQTRASGSGAEVEVEALATEAATPSAKAPPATPAPIPELEQAPILASAKTLPAGLPHADAPGSTPRSGAAPRTEGDAAIDMPELRERAPDSLRHPSRLPADVPLANVAAFTHLPIAKRDKAPIAGAGVSGVHLDELELGKGFADSRCEEPSTQFQVGSDERVSVCFRVVHPRAEERVSVEWARDGEVRQRIRVKVKPTHAYLTRAWLPVTAGRAGDWTATVKSDDGTVLGEIRFEIAP